MDNLASEILKDLRNPEQTTEVRQLFIGNLPFRVRWQDIKDLFRKAGHIVRADVALNHENRSKGHGTVLFSTVEEAQKAMEMFNGYKWQGRTLEVRGDRSFEEDKEQQRQQEAEEEKTSVQGSETPQEVKNTPKSPPPPAKAKTEEPAVNDDCKQLFVGNIPFHCQPSELKELFATCGRILKVDIVLNFEGRSRGFGTVLFSSHEDAKKAIEKFDSYEFHNRILRVHFDKFAATHQKLREQEAETYGQRQLQDPVSVQLLKETYLPQQQMPSYNQLLNGLLKPPQQQQQQYTDPYAQYAQQYQVGYMQQQPAYGMYQQESSSMGYDNRERYIPQQNYYQQPWMTSPSLMQQQQQQRQYQQQPQQPQQPQQQQQYDDRLSSSFDRLNLNGGSAGLNNDSPLWNLYK